MHIPPTPVLLAAIHPITCRDRRLHAGDHGDGILASRKEARTSSGYFLAGRSLGWPMIGLALFATNISTVHLVGLASSATPTDS